jgi:hypothetical protein
LISTSNPFNTNQSKRKRHGNFPWRFSLSGKWGSNPRPSAWEANALPTELLPLKVYKEHLVSTQLVLTLQPGLSLK